MGAEAAPSSGEPEELGVGAAWSGTAVVVREPEQGAAVGAALPAEGDGVGAGAGATAGAGRPTTERVATTSGCQGFDQRGASFCRGGSASCVSPEQRRAPENDVI